MPLCHVLPVYYSNPESLTMNNLPYIKLKHTHTYMYIYIYVSKPESRNPVFIALPLDISSYWWRIWKCFIRTAEDTAIKTLLRGIFVLVGITESTVVDNMFFCRQILLLSLLHIFVQRIYWVSYSKQVKREWMNEKVICRSHVQPVKRRC